MNNNISTKGNGSPVIIGDKNKIKISIKQKLAYGIGGFIVGVLASLVANWIWQIFC